MVMQIYTIHVLCYDIVKHCEGVKKTKIMKHNNKMIIHFSLLFSLQVSTINAVALIKYG